MIEILYYLTIHIQAITWLFIFKDIMKYKLNNGSKLKRENIFDKICSFISTFQNLLNKILEAPKQCWYGRFKCPRYSEYNGLYVEADRPTVELCHCLAPQQRSWPSCKAMAQSWTQRKPVTVVLQC